MRTLHFYLDQDNGICVNGIKSGSQVTSINVVRNDTLQIILHRVSKNSAVPALTPYVESSINFTAARCSIGLIDAPPTSGTFKFKVGTQTSAQLTWPADLSTPALVSAWKTTMLTALKAMSNVGNDAIRMDDPIGSPAHFNFFTWTDATRTDPITVVQNRLLPLTLPKPRPASMPDGYTQLLKFAQEPAAMTTAFARPLPPAVTIMETVHGATGTNEEQMLIFPDGASGGLSLQWGGVSTAVMAVDGITDAQIAAALNAIVANGDTNPSFAVAERTAQSGRRVAVTFQGPLTGTAHTMIGVVMSDQVPLPYASGLLDLFVSDLSIEENLDGQTSASLWLEIVLDTPGEETYLLKVVVAADMTDPSTSDDIESGGGDGAVLIRERIVYVNTTVAPTPYVEAAPGAVFVPTDIGTSYVLAHNLNTWNPGVRISQKISDDPVIWQQMPDDQFAADSETANSVHVYFPFALNNTEGDPLNFNNFKIFVTSPDSQIVMFAHQHTWDEVRDYLPDGQTVRAKFAALDAALGTVGGNFTINASHITGLISSTQINLTDLGTALSSSSTFLTTLQTLVSDSTVITNISNALATSSTFLTTLETLAQNSEFLTTLISAITNSSSFATTLITAITNNQTFVNGVLTAIGSAQIPGQLSLPISAASEVLFRSASSQNTRPPLMLPQVISASPTSQTTSTLPALTAATVWVNNSGGALTVSGSGIRSTCDIGGFFASDGRILYAVNQRLSTHSYFPAAFERELWRLWIDDKMLPAGKTLTVSFAVALQLISATSNAQWVLVIEKGTADAETSGSPSPENLQGITWDTANPIVKQRIIVTQSLITHPFGAIIARTADVGGAQVLSAQGVYYSAAYVATGAAPATANFVLRARLIEFDTENSVPTARGYVSWQLVPNSYGQLGATIK